MGYYANYEFDIKDFATNEHVSSDEYDKILEELCEIAEDDILGSCKWVDYEDNIREISKRYPNYYFTIRWYGEDNAMGGDYAYQGKTQCMRVRITYDEFNINKLK